MSRNYRHQGPDGARSGHRKAIGRLPLPTLRGPEQHPESREELLNGWQVDVGAAHSCGRCRQPCLSFPLSRPPEGEAKISQLLPAVRDCEPLKCTKPWSHILYVTQISNPTARPVSLLETHRTGRKAYITHPGCVYRPSARS